MPASFTQIEDDRIIAIWDRHILFIDETDYASKVDAEVFPGASGGLRFAEEIPTAARRALRRRAGR